MAPPILDADVIVVGARIAGTAAAMWLARAGWRVLLLERDLLPGDKACGEGILPQGVVELMALGLGEELRRLGAQPFASIRYVLDGGRWAEGRFPQGHGLGIRRLVLDDLLQRAATRTPGVELRRGALVRDLRCDREGAQVTLEDGRVLGARALIGADGAQSLVRRRLGLDRPVSGPRRWGFRAHLEGCEPPPGRVEVYFRFPGEVYLASVGQGQTLCALLMEEREALACRGEPDLAFWRQLQAVPTLSRRLAGARLTSRVLGRGPLCAAARRPHHDRCLLVGDAAGFLDPVTGEGMALALVSARLAAETLDDALRRDRLTAADLAPYAWRRRAAVRDPLRLTRLALWLARHPRTCRAAVDFLARHPENFAGLLGVNAGQAALGAAAREWLRHALRRPAPAGVGGGR